MTDQPNVEPPGAELGITLEQARDNIGRQVEYVARNLPDGRPAFIERGTLTGVPPAQDSGNAFVTFDNAQGAKATPLDRLRLIERPKAKDALTEIRKLRAAAAKREAAEPEPDESYLGSLAAALYSHGVAQNEITPSMDENDALGLARTALEWMKGRFIAASEVTSTVTGQPQAPAVPSWPQYQPAPYPMQWGDQPAPWGQPPPAPLGEVPDLIEQREWLPMVTPHAAGDRVIYRGRPIDPPLLALVVSVQQSPSGVVSVCQYTVRVPYLGQTLGAYADQLAPWYEPEPDF